MRVRPARRGAVPARALFAEPAVTEIGVSADGAWVSQLVRHRRGEALTVRRVVDGALDGVERTVARERGITAHGWLPSGDTLLYLADGGDGDRAFTVDVSTGKRGEVTPEGATGLTLVDPDTHRELGPLLSARDPDGRLVLHRVAGAGRAAVPIDAAGEAGQWFLDRDDRLRAATRLDDDGVLHVLARSGDGWTVVRKVPPPAALSTHPVEVSADGGALLFVAPTGIGRMGLIAVDLGSGAERTVFAQDGADLDYVETHPRSRAPQLLVFAGPRARYRPLDDEARAALEGLRRMNPGDPQIVSRSWNDRTWVVRFDGADSPPAHVVWHREEGRGEPLRDPYPALRRRTLGTPRPVSFEARDGWTLDGYLTRPRTAGPEPGPMVLRVHGGPWTRDAWEFQPDPHWLAGHGYTCLQVNFRGSDGSGPRFLDAADGDWGGAPQDDLEDAVHWAVREGHAASGRVAIAGQSYGGYAALVAATMRPRLFACAVAVCAPVDLVDFVAHIRDARLPTRGHFLHRVGHPDRDRDRLARRSPLGHAASCHTPVLLAHGRADPLVPVRHTERFAAALAAAGRPTEPLLFRDEGHGIAGRRDRVRLARAVARFLAAHLDRGRR
ncbi:alpha/beta hydrolase family protein [Actinomadura madurae]|uniref:alpha/beta hydrolase family protein n=1 Tax=Actinomadura madurae TaxID=1993 RepID=UPI0011BF8AB7|nr:prolyl oligopeptidase family serine peptidase [Actinomadura madurae]